MENNSIKLLKSVVNSILEAKYPRPEGEFDGLETGLKDFDRMTGGFRKGEFSIIASASAMGRRGFMISIMAQLALNGKNVLFFSTASTDTLIMYDLISNIYSIDKYNLRSGNISKEEVAIIASSFKDEWINHVFIVDEIPICPDSIEYKIHSFGSKIDMVLIDDLSDMVNENHENYTRDHQKEISNRIKDMALLLDIPILASVEIDDKFLEGKEDKRPKLNYLRRSCCYDNHADRVMLIYRPEYYGMIHDENGVSCKNIAKLIAVKNKYGFPDQTISFFFETRNCKFSTIMYEENFSAELDNLSIFAK